MAASMADAERLRIAAQRSGAPVFVGHIYLYNPAFRAALAAAPTLGAVQHMVCETGGNNLKPGESLLWEWLPHHLSMARELLRGKVTAVVSQAFSDASSPHLVVSRFFFSEAALVSIVNSGSPFKRRQATITCERGSIVFDDTIERKVTVYENDEGVHPSYSDILPLTCEIEAFLRVARTGVPDRSHLEDGIEIARLIAAAEESMLNQGRRVEL